MTWLHAHWKALLAAYAFVSAGLWLTLPLWFVPATLYVRDLVVQLVARLG